MDRQLAERMVGAACLLAVLVLVVPSILDGNQHSEIAGEPVPAEVPDLRTHTLSLSNTERVPPVPQLRDVPGEPAGTLPPEESPADEIAVPLILNEAEPPAPSTVPEPARQAVVAATTDDAVARAPAPGKPAVADTGEWYVQLGSFSNRLNADGLARKLKAAGFNTTIRKSNNGSMSRVLVGPRADRDAAVALAEKLSGAGFKGQVTRL